MAGIILMIIGVLVFAGGFFIYISSNKSVKRINAIESQKVVKDEYRDSSESQKSIVSSNKSVKESNNTELQKPIEVEKKINSNELNKVIDIAIADGVLTKNERNVIKQITEQKGLNYDNIIKDIESRISELHSNTAETELIDYNKKNGDDFEKFVAQKFDKKFFKIKEWAGDKYVNGVYAKTTQQPDILLEFSLKNQTAEFSVECKWRSKYYMKGVEFANPDQFKRYQHFEENKKVPVFIAIGIGGRGGNPEKLYIVPLKKIKSNFIPLEDLKEFEKEVENNFFFDFKTKELK